MPDRTFTPGYPIEPRPATDVFGPTTLPSSVSGAGSWAGLSDKATADLPADNAPLAAALASVGAASITNPVTVTVATSATPADATFVAFASQACTEIIVHNQFGVDIEYQRGGAGDAMVIPVGQTRRIAGITNASQIGFRRCDYANTPTTTLQTTVIGYARTNTQVLAGASIRTYTVVSTAQALSSYACAGVDVVNTTGKRMLVRIGSSTAPAITLDPGASHAVLGLTNANQIFLQPFDSVAASLRPLTVEAFTSGLTGTLNSQQPQNVLSMDARIALRDQMYPDKWPTPPFSTLAGIVREKQTLQRKGIALARFTTAAATTSNRPATLADVSSPEAQLGTTALEYTATGGTDQTFFAETGGILPAAINVNGGNIYLSYCFPEGAAQFTSSVLDYVGVRLYSSGTPATYSGVTDYHRATMGGGTATVATPFIIRSKVGNVYTWGIPLSSFGAVGAGADLTQILYAVVEIKGNGAGSVGAKFRPVSVEWSAHTLTKGSVIFAWDGPQRGLWENALPMMARYKYPGVAFLATTAKAGGAGANLTPKELQILHRVHGWQLANHTYARENVVSMSVEEMLGEHANYIVAMNALGVDTTQDCCQGTQTVTNILDYNYEAVKRTYRSCRLYLTGNTTGNPLTMGETVPFGDPYRIKSVSLNGPTNQVTSWQAHVDQAIANKGVAIFTMHAENNTAGSSTNVNFQTLLDYIRTQELAGTVTVDTLDSLIKRAYG